MSRGVQEGKYAVLIIMGEIIYPRFVSKQSWAWVRYELIIVEAG